MAKISVIEECLYICRRSSITPFIWGHRGIGKSSVPKQIALREFWGLIDCRCSQMESSDIRGMPDKIDGRTHFLPPADMPIGDLSESEIREKIGVRPEDDGSRHYVNRLGAYLQNLHSLQPRFPNGILYLDELNRAQDDVLQAIFQLVLDLKVGTYTLPPGWSIIAAGNYMEGYQVNSFTDPAFINRFCHLIFSSGETTLEEWINYMITEHGSKAGSVIEFASQNIKHLDGDIKGDLGFIIQPSRRSWEMVTRVLDVCEKYNHSEEAKREVISGLVGRELALSFTRYSCPVKPKDLITNGVNSYLKQLGKLDRNQLTGLMWGLVSFCKQKIEVDSVANVCLDFASFIAKHSSDKDLVVAFCRALVTDGSVDAQSRACTITNTRLAKLVAEYNKQHGGKKTFIDRLVERPEIHELIANVSWGKDDND